MDLSNDDLGELENHFGLFFEDIFYGPVNWGPSLDPFVDFSNNDLGELEKPFGFFSGPLGNMLNIEMLMP